MWNLIHKVRLFFSGYYYFLLLCLLLLFVFRPFTNNIYYVATWKFLLSTTIITSIFNADHHHSIRVLALTLFGPTIIFCWLDLLYPSPQFFILNAIATTLFLFICTSSILFDVILKARVTLETLRGVICAYFMIGFAFAYFFYLIEFILPGSYRLIGTSTNIYDNSFYLVQLLYFSFVTLLTIGFGDISPTGSLSQTITVLEGVIGQFYIAMLVARLVSVYSIYQDDHPKQAAYFKRSNKRKPTAPHHSPKKA